MIRRRPCQFLFQVAPKWPFVFLLLLSLLCILSLYFFNGPYILLKEVTRPNTPRSPIPNNTIKLLSYNVWCNYIFRADAKATCQERLLTLIKNVADYDVLHLQEVFVMRVGPIYFTDYVNVLTRETQKQGFLYRNSFLDSLTNVFLAQNNGLASLSKLPVKCSKSVAFECSSIWEFPTAKGYSFLQIPIKYNYYLGKKTEKILNLFNVHFDAHKIETRGCQLQEIQNHVKMLPFDSYIVISGDFNIDPLKGDINEYWALQGAMKNVGLQEVYEKSNVTFRDGSHYDHAFISRNIRVLGHAIKNFISGIGEPISDHYGLLMVLKLM